MLLAVWIVFFFPFFWGGGEAYTCVMYGIVIEYMCMYVYHFSLYLYLSLSLSLSLKKTNKIVKTLLDIMCVKISKLAKKQKTSWEKDDPNAKAMQNAVLKKKCRKSMS
jgi:hypothetical protein